MNPKTRLIAAAMLLAAAPVSMRAGTDDPEEQAVQAVERLGGRVHRDEDQVGRPVVVVQFPNNPVSDKDLEILSQFKHLQYADIGSPNVTDAGLKVLEGCSELRGLDLRNSPQITEAGLKHVAGLTKLRVLTLGKPVTDAGLKELAGLTEMQELYLCGGAGSRTRG